MRPNVQIQRRPEAVRWNERLGPCAHRGHCLPPNCAIVDDVAQLHTSAELYQFSSSVNSQREMISMVTRKYAQRFDPDEVLATLSVDIKSEGVSTKLCISLLHDVLDIGHNIVV
jgi:hypothetical protein